LRWKNNAIRQSPLLCQKGFNKIIRICPDAELRICPRKIIKDVLGGFQILLGLFLSEMLNKKSLP
jgi:hypothetical protein